MKLISLKELNMSTNFKYTHEVLIYPLGLVLLIWIIYWIEIKFSLNFNNYGIYPLRVDGLKGILFSAFIHSGIKHLFNNSVPLLLLSMSLFYFYRDISKRVIIYGILITGLLTWIIGRPSYHIGASGLVYVLASFLFFKGIFSRYYRLVALSLSVVFVYGSLVWGLFPGKTGMSWEGHLSGFIVGLLLALIFRTQIVTQPKYSWQSENYNAEEDEFMQQFDENGNFIEKPEEDNTEKNTGDSKIKTIKIRYFYKEKSSKEEKS
jgi:membrane associated rhomboid family serine protease